MLAAFPEAKDCFDKQSGTYTMINDDIVFRFEKNTQAPSNQLVKGVCLNVTDMKLSTRYWTKLGLQPQKGSIFTFKDYPFFELSLRQVKEIDRADAFGRLAIACAEADVENVFKNSGSEALNAPVTLPTDGKADVVVTILASPDGQEICFVGDTGFKDLSKETGEKVDWERYDKLNTKQKAYMARFKKGKKKAKPEEQKPEEKKPQGGQAKEGGSALDGFEPSMTALDDMIHQLETALGKPHAKSPFDDLREKYGGSAKAEEAPQAAPKKQEESKQTE